MAAEIDPAIESLASLGAPLFQYKCCSTFDSSPLIGSLGEAGRRMAKRWPGRAMAVLAAMPEFGRFTIFGNHFARYESDVHRLDRHPVTSRHPSTPMHEADLLRVLAAQSLVVGDRATVERIDAAEDAEALAGSIDWGRGPVVFDSCTNAQLVRAAGAIWDRACRSSGMLSIASQGLAHGLGQYLRAQGVVRGAAPSHSLAPAERLLGPSWRGDRVYRTRPRRPLAGARARAPRGELDRAQSGWPRRSEADTRGSCAKCCPSSRCAASSSGACMSPARGRSGDRRARGAAEGRAGRAPGRAAADARGVRGLVTSISPVVG